MIDHLTPKGTEALALALTEHIHTIDGIVFGNAAAAILVTRISITPSMGYI
ncbi:MAG: hypothetical protein ABFC74_07690 [Rectinema sp.]